MIDKIDINILNIIQSNPRMSRAVVAEQVGMTKTAVFERIRKMEKAGIISGYETRLNPKRLRKGLVAFVFVRTEEPFASQATGKALTRIPEVLEVHNMAGEDCYLVKVRVENTDALGKLLREKFSRIKAIRATRTNIALDTLKESMFLSLDSITARGHE